jgi:hypothetical protein
LNYTLIQKLRIIRKWWNKKDTQERVVKMMADNLLSKCADVNDVPFGDKNEFKGDLNE